MVDAQQEIEAGQRFAFGANWSAFLSVMSEQRIEVAQKASASYSAPSLSRVSGSWTSVREVAFPLWQRFGWSRGLFIRLCSEVRELHDGTAPTFRPGVPTGGKCSRGRFSIPIS